MHLSKRIEKAKLGGPKVNAVYILARVYNVHTDPQIILYVDPWQLHKEGHINLESASYYRGKISPGTPGFLSDNCTGLTSGTELDKVYEKLQIKVENKIRLLRLKLNPEHDINGDQQLLRAHLGVYTVSSVTGNVELESMNSDPQGLDTEPLSRKHGMTPGASSSTGFLAISYVWGNRPTKDGPFLEVNGVVVPITLSLWTCLCRLRDDGEEAPIWADAICINQSDDVEKAFQVRRMGALYQKASRVIIWTGNDTDMDNGVIRLISNLQQQSKMPLSPQKDRQDQLGEAQRVEKFLGRAWFTRTWTIQELVFGNNVFIASGDSKMPWDVFIEGILECERQSRQNAYTTVPEYAHLLANSDAALALHKTRQYYKGTTPGEEDGRLKYSFLDLLERFHYAKASKDRDKLFALLNLAYDTTTSHPAFYPDYDPKTTDEAIMSRYASEFVKSGKALDLLYRAGEEKGSAFCSWIPDLMNKRRQATWAPTISTWPAVANESGTTGKGFHSGGPYSLDATILRDVAHYNGETPILAIKGKLVDTIQSRQSLDMAPSGKMIYFSKILDELRRYTAPLYSASDPAQTIAIIRCLIGDAVGPQSAMRTREATFGEPRRSTPHWSSPWPAGFEAEVANVRPGQDARSYIDKPAATKRLINQFWETAMVFLQRIPHASASLTVNRRVAIVPGVTMPGDVIFVPHNSKVPFVLREEKQQHYKLIGECYVHNMMYHDPGQRFSEDEVHLV